MKYSYIELTLFTIFVKNDARITDNDVSITNNKKRAENIPPPAFFYHSTVGELRRDCMQRLYCPVPLNLQFSGREYRHL